MARDGNVYGNEEGKILEEYRKTFGDKTPMEVYGEKMDGVPAKTGIKLPQKDAEFEIFSNYDDGYTDEVLAEDALKRRNSPPEVAVKVIGELPDVFGKDAGLLSAAIGLWDRNPLAFVKGDGAVSRHGFDVGETEWMERSADLLMRKGQREYILSDESAYDTPYDTSLCLKIKEGTKALTIVFSDDAFDTPECTALRYQMRQNGIPDTGIVPEDKIDGIEKTIRDTVNHLLNSPIKQMVGEMLIVQTDGEKELSCFRSSGTDSRPLISWRTRAGNSSEEEWANTMNLDADGPFAEIPIGKMPGIMNDVEPKIVPFSRMSDVFSLEDGKVIDRNTWPFNGPVEISDRKKTIIINRSEVFTLNRQEGRMACTRFENSSGWATYNDYPKPKHLPKNPRKARLSDLPDKARDIVKGLLDSIPERFLNARTNEREF